jgi:hypothetical protein
MDPMDLHSLCQFSHGVPNSLLIAILNNKFDLDDLHKLEPKFNKNCKQEEKREIFGSDSLSLWVTVDKASSKKLTIISKESFAAVFAVYAEVKKTPLYGCPLL